MEIAANAPSAGTTRQKASKTIRDGPSRARCGAVPGPTAALISRLLSGERSGEITPYARPPQVGRAAAALAATAFTCVWVAYAVAAQVSGQQWTTAGSQLTALWAAVFGSVAVAYGVMVATAAAAALQGEGAPMWGRLTAALVWAAPLALFAAFVGNAALRDAHGAAWGAVACVAASLVLAFSAASSLLVVSSPMAWRAKRSATPTVDFSGVHDAEEAPLVTGSCAGDSLGSGAALTATAAPPQRRQHSSCCCGGTTCGACSEKHQRRCRACCEGCCAWSFLLLSSVLLFGFSVQGPAAAWEAAHYPPPGRLLSVPLRPAASANGTAAAASLRLHLHCVGNRSGPAAPAFVFESGGGSCGFSFLGAQAELAARGWRSCAYDRAGFGWSDPQPLGEGSVADTRDRLKALLSAAAEPPPYILAGHSAGGELVQARGHQRMIDRTPDPALTAAFGLVAESGIIGALGAAAPPLPIRRRSLHSTRGMWLAWRYWTDTRTGSGEVLSGGRPERLHPTPVDRMGPSGASCGN